MTVIELGITVIPHCSHTLRHRDWMPSFNMFLVAVKQTQQLLNKHHGC